MPVIAKRVNRLEHIVEDFVASVGVEYNKLCNSQMRTEAELREFKDEMREFKKEMSVFKNEMTDFKDEMRGFKDEMSVFKDAMSGFKDEMRGFKDENRLQIRQMNIKWGEIAKKLGTITEDLVAPSIPRIVKEAFGLEVVDLMIRRKKKLADGRTKEYDAVAVAGEYVFVDSTRSTLDCDSVTEFVEDIQKFREFFPEYAKNKIVGILASLHVNEGILAYAGKMGFVVLSVGDEIMEVKNPKGFKPKEW